MLPLCELLMLPLCELLMLALCELLMLALCEWMPLCERRELAFERCERMSLWAMQG